MPKTADGAAVLAVDGASLVLSGELGFATVGQVLEAGRRAIGGIDGADAVLDLSGVGKSDSAGLALVVDWLRSARARGVRMQVRGVPDQLAGIARLSGLEGLILAQEADDAA